MINHKFNQKLIVESYGVICVVRTNSRNALTPIRGLLERYLPGCVFPRSDAGAGHEFFYQWSASGRDLLYKDRESLGTRSSRAKLLESLGSAVRIAVAEYAVDRVFIHAGVVGWKGKAIVIPARSFKGKSTLTAELVRQGARYYSDEYAVLDRRGRVHPFPKALSLRGRKDEYEQVDRPVEVLGGKAGKRPIPVGMVVVTEYKKGARWSPKILDSGRGMMELINNAVAIRRDPNSVLPVLSKVAGDAVFVRSQRGEADITAQQILQLFEMINRRI